MCNKIYSNHIKLLPFSVVLHIHSQLTTLHHPDRTFFLNSSRPSKGSINFQETILGFHEKNILQVVSIIYKRKCKQTWISSNWCLLFSKREKKATWYCFHLIKFIWEKIWKMWQKMRHIECFNWATGYKNLFSTVMHLVWSSQQCKKQILCYIIYVINIDWYWLYWLYWDCIES